MVPQARKLPQHKLQLVFLQPVSQLGIRPVSLAQQSLALIYLHGLPSNLGHMMLHVIFDIPHLGA
eukprot:14446346-Ditylum_brightwellii.AAC.1